MNERGRYLGQFDTEDNIMVIYKDGQYELTNFELTNRYDINKVIWVEKFSSESVITAVQYEGKQKDYYVKRFQVETSTIDKKFKFISEENGSKLVFATTYPKPEISFKVITPGKGRAKEEVKLELSAFIDVKGWRALGNKLDRRKVSTVKELTPKLIEKTDTERR